MKQKPSTTLLILVTVLALTFGPLGVAPVQAAGIYTHSIFVERAIDRLSAYGGYTELVDILNAYPAVVNYGATFPDTTLAGIDDDWAEMTHDTGTLRNNYTQFQQFMDDRGYTYNWDLQAGRYREFLEDPDYTATVPAFRAALMAQIVQLFNHSPRSAEDEKMIAFLFGVIAHQEADIPWHWNCDDPGLRGLECAASADLALNEYQLEMTAKAYHGGNNSDFAYVDTVYDTVLAASDATGYRRPYCHAVCVAAPDDPIRTGTFNLSAYWVVPGIPPGWPWQWDGFNNYIYNHVPGGIYDGGALVAGAWMQTWDMLSAYTPLTIVSTDPAAPDCMGGWYCQEVTVTFSATDNLNGQLPTAPFTIHYTVDGGIEQFYTGPFTLSTDGIHTISVHSVDRLGNAEIPQTLTLNIDITHPTITINNPDTLPALSKTITASTSDGALSMSNTTGITCDGTLTFVAYASQTFTSEADNGIRVCYRAEDVHGNTAYSLSDAIAGIDTTAPTITIDNPDTLPATSKTITASASDGTLSMSNTTGMTCDGTLTFVAYASQTFTSEADNGTRVCYQAVDVAGNIAYSLSDPIAGIDTTAPTITINNPDTLPATSKTITASASDGTLSMSNTTGATCDGTLTFVAYASQTFTSEADNGTRVCYQAVDTAGNTAYSLSNAIAGIDTTAPTITINEPDTLPATSKTITASTSDGTLSMSNTTGATCDGTLTFVAYASQTFTSEADNGTRVCYRAVDALGNTAYSLSNPIAGIDTTAPTITINEPDTLPALSKTITASTSDGTLSMSNTTGATCDGTLTFVAYASQTFTSEADNGTRVCYRAVDALSNTAYSLSNAIAGIDRTAPTLTSFTLFNPAASPTNADTLVFRAAFDEDVQNVDATDFTVTGTTAGITGVNPVSASLYELTVSGGDLAGLNGTVGLDLAGNNIADLAGNALPAGEPTTDETYVVDNTAASVTSILRQTPPGSPTSLPSVTFRVTFGEDVQNVDPTDFTLALGGTATGTINAIVVQFASVYDVVLTGVGGNGTIDLNFAPTNNIADMSSNPLGAAPTVGTRQTYTIDTTYPTVVFGGSTVPANNSGLFVGPNQIVIEFSKDVLADGSPNAANLPANYLLVARGTNGAFDTLACGGTGGGLQPDDLRITVNSVTYTNNGGAGPFLATLTINNGGYLPVGVYRLYICGTSSIYDPAGNRLNNGLDSALNFTVTGLTALPATGFAPGRITLLPEQTVAYTDSDLWLEIPRLGLRSDIVGVPATNGTWDVSWLGQDTGWLQGSAYPTLAGNSVLTGHVYDANGLPGPFVNLNQLWYGDRIIVHAFGQQYIYEVRSVRSVRPADTASITRHEDLPWLTLVTCRGYDETADSYRYRVVVRAVQVEIR